MVSLNIFKYFLHSGARERAWVDFPALYSFKFSRNLNFVDLKSTFWKLEGRIGGKTDSCWNTVASLDGHVNCNLVML